MLEKVQLCLLLSVEQKVRQPVPSNMNWHWRPKRVLLSQRALKCCSNLEIPKGSRPQGQTKLRVTVVPKSCRLVNNALMLLQRRDCSLRRT